MVAVLQKKRIQQKTVGAVVGAWVLVVISALMVVYGKYSIRAKVSELEALSTALDQTQVELGRLLLEQGTVASFDRVEKYSETKLKMRAPRYDEIVWLTQQ